MYVGWAVQPVRGPVHGQRETFLLAPVQHGSTPLSGGKREREKAVRVKEIEKKGKEGEKKGGDVTACVCIACNLQLSMYVHVR